MKNLKILLLAPILLTGCVGYDTSQAQFSSSFYSNVPGDASISIITNQPVAPYGYYYGNNYPYWNNGYWNYNRPPYWNNGHRPNWNNQNRPPNWNNNRPNRPPPSVTVPRPSVNNPRPPRSNNTCSTPGCATPWVKPN